MGDYPEHSKDILMISAHILLMLEFHQVPMSAGDEGRQGKTENPRTVV